LSRSTRTQMWNYTLETPENTGVVCCLLFSLNSLRDCGLKLSITQCVSNDSHNYIQRLRSWYGWKKY
jgi:hypothetical protein